MTISELKQIQKEFVRQLIHANEGEKTSLPFIRTPLPEKKLVQPGEKFQAMVIGGTVFINAVCKRTKSGFDLLWQEQKHRPIFPNRTVFLEFIEQHISHDITCLGLNFAHALEPIMRKDMLDGKLLFGSKENLYKGLVGKNVGEEIERYILEKRKKKVKISVANDTICILLSGLVDTSYEKLVGGVIGTGVNFSFFSNNHEVINLESGCFEGFIQSNSGKMIDSESIQKGKYLFEKEVAGAYLYRHFNILLKKNHIHYPPITQTVTLDQIIIHKTPIVGRLAKKIMERSASLIACQIAGITDFKQRDLTFIVQGSVFWKGHGYKQIVDDLLLKLIPNFKVTFLYKEHADILGAAELVA